jgi:hypothetical protein
MPPRRRCIDPVRRWPEVPLVRLERRGRDRAAVVLLQVDRTVARQRDHGLDERLLDPGVARERERERGCFAGRSGGHADPARAIVVRVGRQEREQRLARRPERIERGPARAFRDERRVHVGRLYRRKRAEQDLHPEPRLTSESPRARGHRDREPPRDLTFSASIPES